MYSLHREVHPENVLYANICIKNVHFTAEVRFYGAWVRCRHGAGGGREGGAGRAGVGRAGGYHGTNVAP